MQIKLQINPAQTHQTMEGFGASGAWWAQLVGGWPDELRQEILRLLYHKENGLGMDIYRCNLGGGSKESGKGNFSDPQRRASDFLTPDNRYDWSRDTEAVWCMKEAVRNGASEIALFVNSPPERWTVTGTAKGKILFRANLARKNELKFATYMLDVAEHFLAEGVPVKFLSPVNEPFGPWIEKLSGQEGCHYHPQGMRRLMRLFVTEMDKRPALKDVMLSGAEMNDLRYMNKTYTRALLKDKLIRTRLHGIDVHGYVLKPLAFLQGVKQRFRRYMDRRFPGDPIRMTEWTEMRGGQDCGMQSALVLANEVFEDLSIMNVVSWQLWIAVSEYDFCDGLIYIDPTERSFKLPKRYFAYGHFTKFIPRGAQRIGLDGLPADLQGVAFQCATHTAVVLLNQTEQAVTVSLGSGAAEMYETNDTKSLEKSDISLDEFTLAGKSVNTIVIKK